MDHGKINVTRLVASGRKHGSGFHGVQHRTMHAGVVQATLDFERQLEGSQQLQKLAKLAPGSPVSGDASIYATTTSTEHVTKVSPKINNVHFTVPNTIVNGHPSIGCTPGFPRHHGDWYSGASNNIRSVELIFEIKQGSVWQV